MNLREAVQGLVTSLLNEFSVHPLIAPFLNVSRDDPPEHFLHQHEVAARLAPRLPIRAFIADEIGLGKTVTAIAVAKYLENMRGARRMLIIVPRILILQWRKELARMGVPASKIHQLERWNIRELRALGFPAGYYVASMDLLKKRRHLEKVADAQWDLIIVDEAHRFGYRTERFFNIGKKLIEAYPERNVLFLSATPHRGDARDYIERLKLLDPFLGGWRELDRSRRFYEATHGAILFRRTKEDINNIYEGRQIFPPARFYACLVKASNIENEFVREMVYFLRSKLVEFAYERGLFGEKIIPLLTVLVFKRASSSPYSAYTTMQRLLARRAGVDEERLRKLVAPVNSFLKVGYEECDYERDPDEVFNEFLEESSALLSDEDVAKIESLRDMAREIMEKCDTKLNALCRLLEWVRESRFKAVVFTEYKDTLKYLAEQIKRRYSSWKILTLSSEEAHDEEKFKSIKSSFERDPDAWLLIATDVVAEGVNLQVANILINYEIPWSLVKLEQRIGRVWRLGQRREVEAYTIFMDNLADRAALNAMYAKLINLRRAEIKPRPFTGEEVLWYSEGREIFEAPPQIALEEKAGRKAFRRVTEHRVIQTFIREGQSGLERLIGMILAAKRELEVELRSKSVLYMPKSREEVERALESLGFGSPRRLMESLKSLARSAAQLLGCSIEERGGVLRVKRGLEMPTSLITIDDFFGMLGADSSSTPATLVSYGEGDALFLARLKVKFDGTVVYSEPIGIFASGRVVRGADLLAKISEALSKCIGASIEEHLSLKPELRASAASRVRESLNKVLSPITSYRTNLQRSGLRDRDSWPSESRLEIEVSQPFGLIRFVKEPPKNVAEPPEDIKRRVEEEAIRIALKIEADEGRIATPVPESEHYDIKSIDPRTGELRKIEVKGHAGCEVYAELTDEEAKLAGKEGERYWLYIVYDVKSGSPKILKFRDPIKTMNWKIFERVERRWLLWPKNKLP
jgi:superfamily II DNA or RNA helicase